MAWKRLTVDDLRLTLAEDEINKLDTISTDLAERIQKQLDAVADLFRAAFQQKGYDVDVRAHYVDEGYLIPALNYARYQIWTTFANAEDYALTKPREDLYKTAVDLLKTPYLATSKPDYSDDPAAAEEAKKRSDSSISMPWLRMPGEVGEYGFPVGSGTAGSCAKDVDPNPSNWMRYLSAWTEQPKLGDVVKADTHWKIFTVEGWENLADLSVDWSDISASIDWNAISSNLELSTYAKTEYVDNATKLTPTYTDWEIIGKYSFKNRYWPNEDFNEFYVTKLIDSGDNSYWYIYAKSANRSYRIAQATTLKTALEMSCAVESGGIWTPQNVTLNFARHVGYIEGNQTDKPLASLSSMDKFLLRTGGTLSGNLEILTQEFLQPGLTINEDNGYNICKLFATGLSIARDDQEGPVELMWPSYSSLSAALDPGIGTVATEEYVGENYKLKQTAKESPTASGNATSFIDTISQDEDGEITATKKTIPTATTSQAGIVQLNNTLTSTLSTQAATASTVKTLNDKFASYLPLSGGTITSDTGLIISAQTPQCGTVQIWPYWSSSQLPAVELATHNGKRTIFDYNGIEMENHTGQSDYHFLEFPYVDGTLAVTSNLRYDIGSTRTITNSDVQTDTDNKRYAEITLVDRTLNSIEIFAGLNKLKIVVPTVEFENQVQDFGLQVNNANGSNDLAIEFADSTITAMTNDGNLPTVPANTFAIIWFTLISTKQYMLKGEVLKVAN